MTTAPLIVTERLELWMPAKDDAAVMREIVTHEETGRFLGSATSPAEHFQRFCRNAGSWFLYGYGSFIVRLRSSGEVIGNCGIFHSWRGLGDDFDDRPEAGWILRHDQVGRGVGREAVTAAIDWFERAHGPQRIMCMIAEGNVPSLALAARLGFAPLRDAVLPDGETVRLLARPESASQPA